MTVYRCCRCCGTDDPDYGDSYHAVRTCPTADRHTEPCALCRQPTATMTTDQASRGAPLGGAGLPTGSPALLRSPCHAPLTGSRDG